MRVLRMVVSFFERLFHSVKTMLRVEGHFDWIKDRKLMMNIGVLRTRDAVDKGRRWINGRLSGKRNLQQSFGR